MRMDLPQCSFKDCRKCFDGNCRNIEDYRGCEFAITKSRLNARINEEIKSEEIEESLCFAERIRQSSDEELYSIISSIWNNNNDFITRKLDELDAINGTNTLILTNETCRLIMELN